MDWTDLLIDWTRYIGMQALVIFGAVCAIIDGMFTPKQMIAKGFKQGLPFVAHGGMSGDFILISALVAVLWGMYGDQWVMDPNSRIIGIVSVILSMTLHLWYVKTPFPEAHMYNQSLRLSGAIHIVYMAYAFYTCGMFFFRTEGINPAVAVTVAITLGVHMFFGTHAFLGVLKLFGWNPTWYPHQPLKWTTTWAQLIPLWTGLTIWAIYTVSKAKG